MAATTLKFPEKSPYFPETAQGVMKAHADFMKDMKDPAWLTALRRAAIAEAQKQGLPSSKLEGWKFTNILPLVKGYGADIGRTPVSYANVPGVNVKPLMEAMHRPWVQALLNEPVPESWRSEASLWHLCNAYFRDGVAVDVAPDTIAPHPLEILMECYDGTMFMVRTAIHLGRNARLTIIEDHRGGGSFWKNRLSHVRLDEGAHLTHVRIQEDPDTAVYTQTTNVHVAAAACYEAVALYTGGALSRNQVHVALEGVQASCSLSGVTLMQGHQHADTTILVEHLAPNCRSNQNMRTVLDDSAHGVFQGKVHVHQPAQKTDGYQLSKALLLSEGAVMDTKPELEIYADDVKCSHGATAGQIDEDALFYLRARGIPDREARSLLVRAFIGEAFDSLTDDALRVRLMGKVDEWLR